jgi:hypothetical protein
MVLFGSDIGMGTLAGLVLGLVLGGLGGTWYWGQISRKQVRDRAHSSATLLQPVEQAPQADSLRTTLQDQQASEADLVQTLEARHRLELRNTIAQLEGEHQLRLDGIVNAMVAQYEATINRLETQLAQAKTMPSQASVVSPIEPTLVNPDPVTAAQGDVAQQRFAAQTLAAQVATQRDRAAYAYWFPTLLTLAEAPDATVRALAIAGLGQVKSEIVIPVLEKALRDPDLTVVQAAAGAIANFKQYPLTRAVEELSSEE